MYTGFLRGYDQTLGMKSYGASVDLLVEYYYPMAQVELVYSAITEKAYAGRGMRGHMLFVMMEI